MVFALHLFYGGRNPLSRFWKAATYIPKAKVFFRPLYYEYSGNFKVSHDRKKWANRKFDVFFQSGSTGDANQGTFVHFLTQLKGDFPLSVTGLVCGGGLQGNLFFFFILTRCFRVFLSFSFYFWNLIPLLEGYFSCIVLRFFFCKCNFYSGVRL